MPGPDALETRRTEKSLLDRALSLFTDVRAGEGATAVLMLINIFVLLICYSVIKTVREPLILLGGGAEVRSYAAAGQALLLMGFVPLYSWFASRVDRARLLVGRDAVLHRLHRAVRVCGGGPRAVCRRRLLHLGRHLQHVAGRAVLVVRQRHLPQGGRRPAVPDHRDRHDRRGAARIVGGGAAVSSRRASAEHPADFGSCCWRSAWSCTCWINRRDERRSQTPQPRMSSSGGFQLVLGNKYLRLIAVLIVLLNVVNTTGEYLISRLLTAHVKELAALDPAFNRQAFIGAYAGDYQFWVNVTAFLLQAFVTSRLVKYRGLAGVLLALPLIALGGYSIIAAGAGLGLVRWIKTAENATDYSIMNTARQLLWLPTTREEKYKAKQAIDTFFVRERRRAVGRRGVCRHGHPAPDRPAVRRDQHRPHAGLADDCGADRPSAVDAAAGADAPDGRRRGGPRVPRHRDAGVRTGDARRAARGRARREGDAPS